MPLLGSLGAGSARGFGGIGASSSGVIIDYANANFDTLLDSAQEGNTNTYNVTSGTTYGVRLWGGGASGGKSHHPSTFSLGGRGAQIEGFVVSQGNQFRLSSGSSATSSNDSNGSSGGAGGTAGRGGGSQCQRHPYAKPRFPVIYEKLTQVAYKSAKYHFSRN